MYKRQVSVAIQLAKENRLKGLIFLGGQMDSLDNRLEEIGVPYVLCTVAVNMMAPKRNCSSVSIDDEKESYRAVDYLCKKGHKKIAMISGRRTDPVSYTHLDVYKRQVQLLMMSSTKWQWKI